MAAQAGLCLAWSETPEDTFCRVAVHIYTFLNDRLTIYGCDFESFEAAAKVNHIISCTLSIILLLFVSITDS